MHSKDDRTCYLCIKLHGNYAQQYGLQEHHVVFGWFGAGRKLSEKYGLKVYLCDGHHEHSPEAVHVDARIKRMLCEDAQRAFEAHYPNLSFIDIFGINYIEHTEGSSTEPDMEGTMNKVILMGRLTRDPEVRYSQGENPIAIARYTLAVDRRKTKSNENPEADFINCVAIGHNGEFAEKYLRKGIKICLEGRIQTGSYVNKDGQKVYTTEVNIESQEFAETKRGMSEEDKEARDAATMEAAGVDGFMNIPEGIEEELPFN